MKKAAGFGMALAILAGGVVAWQRVQQRSLELMEKPARVESNYTLEPIESFLSATTTITYEEIANRINSAAPSSVSDSGKDTWHHQTWIKTKGLPKCKMKGLKLYCKDTWIKTKGPRFDVGYRWDATVNRTGPITVTAASNVVRFSLGIEASGNAGLRGDGARFLQLHKKNFRAEATINIDLGVDIDESWCPRLSASILHEWRQSPRIEIIDNIWVDVRSIADKAIAEEKENIIAQVQGAVSCETTRQGVNSLWKHHIFPLPSAQHLTGWVSMLPTAAYLDYVHIGPAGIELRVGLSALIKISTSAPQPIEMAPLPELNRTDNFEEQFFLAVPVVLDYAELTALLDRHLVGRTFSRPTGLGNGTVEISAASIYPSGDVVTIGVAFDGTLPRPVGKISGEVFVSATPALDRERARLSLADLSFSRVLDQEVWMLLSSLFEQEVVGVIETNAVLDLRERMQNLTQGLASTITAEGEARPLRLDLLEPSLTLAKVQSVSEGLLVEVHATGEVEASLDSQSHAE
ncbi:MAG: DUF4403 family protein [Thermoanaerobaculia bacterium]|nr:DUF4403 family protein [Thermoanaerobaculia bacterium]